MPVKYVDVGDTIEAVAEALLKAGRELDRVTVTYTKNGRMSMTLWVNPGFLVEHKDWGASWRADVRHQFVEVKFLSGTVADGIIDRIERCVELDRTIRPILKANPGPVSAGTMNRDGSIK